MWPASRATPARRRRRLPLDLRLLAIISRIELMAQRRRTRMALQELSDHQLKDIGISRADAFREAAKPFWK
ncbi:DUF1127 domain-containing protein [Nitratireductor thuwali]